ncbi:hypothetical protein NDU88_000123 [Pleurodeles waltl]|uniref:Uncharacterized protein n=1 Tax=Pleurodeles waltl TaxID=8319 RepID=A0AAV7SW43_PLEWA|nr:hypothetical protein NDU88_000123 [Pleurodeles waltl]
MFQNAPRDTEEACRRFQAAPRALRRCSVFSRSPSESGRLCYVRMCTTVRMRTGDFVNFAVWNCSPQRALL